MPAIGPALRVPMLGAIALAAALLPGIASAQLPALPPGPKLSISVVSHTLPTQPQVSRVDVPYFREILPRASNGRIEAQLSTHSERNLVGNEIVRLVRSGQVEIGAGTLSTLSGDVPFLDGIDLAGLSPELDTAKRIAEAMIPAANRELERFNTRIIFIMPFPAQEIFCRMPITSLADLRGRKVRTFGNTLVDFVTAVGGQPVSIGFGEVYSALERGVVDCGITGTGSGNAAKWNEVTTHLYNLPLSWALTAYMVNLQWWNRLDPPVRAFMEAFLKEVADKQWELGQLATQDGIDCNAGIAASCRIHTLSTRPMTIVQPTDADRALVRTLFESTMLPNWVRRCGARCGEVYNQVIAPISGVRFGG
jgi:TRAP-type C4-dicarboxylate transport system substrate-binding protein